LNRQWPRDVGLRSAVRVLAFDFWLKPAAASGLNMEEGKQAWGQALGDA